MRPSSRELLEKEYRSRIDRILDYIQSHSGEDLSLARLARKACLSKFHFHRVFQALTRETAGNYVRRIRLEKSAHQLASDPMLSIAQIAENFGFSSSQNYARCFKAHFGYSPTVFRENSKKQNLSVHQSRWTFSDRKTPLPVDVREMPSCRVAYIRDIGPYDLASNMNAFNRLFRWAVDAGLTNYTVARPMAVRWNDPEITPPDECVFDACLTVPNDFEGSGEVGIQNFPGGKYGVLHCEVALENIQDLIRRLCCEWLPRSGYQRDERPFFTVFYNNPRIHPRNLAIMDMCLPLEVKDLPVNKADKSKKEQDLIQR